MRGWREDHLAPSLSAETGIGKKSLRGRREEELPSHSSTEHGVGQAIRAWRRFRGMSVTELAVAAGFGHNGRGYISKIEHQHIRRLGEERLSRIATALHVPSADLLLRRLPESLEEAPAHNLDEAIIGAKALLSICAEQSLERARLQLLLAKLHRDRAETSSLTGVKYAALTEAQSCIECALPIFNAHKASRCLGEVEHLGQEMSNVLETLILPGCQALLKRCAPGSLDWALVQTLRAKFFYERALVVSDSAARTALIEAQSCLEEAMAVFTQKQARRSLSGARQLAQEVKLVLTQLDGMR